MAFQFIGLVLTCSITVHPHVPLNSNEIPGLRLVGPEVSHMGVFEYTWIYIYI